MRANVLNRSLFRPQGHIANSTGLASENSATVTIHVPGGRFLLIYFEIGGSLTHADQPAPASGPAGIKLVGHQVCFGKLPGGRNAAASRMVRPPPQDCTLATQGHFSIGPHWALRSSVSRAYLGIVLSFPWFLGPFSEPSSVKEGSTERH